jgi:hypothetical protein
MDREGRGMTCVYNRSTLLKVILRSFICWIIGVLITIPPVSGQTTLVWVTPGDDIPLDTLKRDIETQDGDIITLAPERRLLIRYETDSACKPETLPGVKDVQPIRKEPVLQDSTGRGMGDRPVTADDEEWIRSRFKPLGHVPANRLSRDRAMLRNRNTIPDIVDNSLSMYFPPVRSQGPQGSCTAWASAYYYSTYAQAMDENLDVSGGDNDHICSPAFMYNLMNNGLNEGATTVYVVDKLNDVGVSSWTLHPYDPYDWTTWPSEAAWIDALKRRTFEPFMIGHWTNGCSNAEMASIKQHLANGHLAVTRTDVYENFYTDYPADTGGIQNGVLFDNSGEYIAGHAMAIVGYDDNRPYYDGSTTRYGAFLIANSWGNSWGVSNTAGGSTYGFIWVAYDYFKASNSCFGVIFINSDRPVYRPRIYAVSGLNHPQRGFIRYGGGTGSGGSPVWISQFALDENGGAGIGISDDRPVAVDLTDGFDTLTFPEISLHVRMTVSELAEDNGTISSAVVYHDLNGDGDYESVESADPPVTVSPGNSGFADLVFEFNEPWLRLTPFRSAHTGFGGYSVSHTLELTNSTGYDDDFQINLDHAAWPSTVTGPNPLTVPAGDTASITFIIGIPAEAYPSQTDSCLVTVTGLGHGFTASSTLYTLSENPDFFCHPDTLFGQPFAGQTFYSVSDLNSQYIVADDFGNVTAPVNRIEWWGGEMECCWSGCSKTSPEFVITFYRDDSGPGAIEYQETVTATGIPLSEHILNQSDYGPAKKYIANLSSPVSLSSGWISIAAVDSGDCLFLIADGGGNPPSGSAFMRYDGSDWVEGGHDMDLAFCLSGSCINHGDVNLDGVITATDAQLAFLITLGQYSPTYEEGCAADCNSDGIVSAADAQAIFMTVLGMSACADPL